MILTIINATADLKNYQLYIDTKQQSMLYHDIKFIKFIAKMLNADWEIMTLLNDKAQICAICPWVYKKGAAGKVYNSLAYFGSNGGIIADNQEAKESLEHQMLAYLQENAASFAYVSNVFEDNRLLANEHYILQERLAQVAHLPVTVSENGDNVMELFHYKTRNMVRKGLKEQITFKTSTNFDFLETTHCQNMEAVGVAPKESAFFTALPIVFEQGQDFQVYEALIDGVQACALLVFYHQKTVEYYMPAILAEYRDKQALSALIFYVMQQEIANGRTIWNWGGTPKSNENLYRFKARWGSTDYPYYYQIKIIDQSLLDFSAQNLAKEYPGMFVAPFDLLKG